MRLWNGIVMYAPRTPDYYALPDMEHCIFRLMHKYGDTQAWNLYWLSHPQTDLIPLHRNDWHAYFASFSGDETRAFYEALETPVLNRMKLSAIMARPPREAIRLLTGADLAKTRFYHLMGGEAWRATLLGRLFLAERVGSLNNSPATTGEIVTADFILHRYARPGNHGYKHIKQPA